ncbi:hypothetical protein CL621_04980 [archaeon]|nr:hypothetical protein [archaeon]|tara:strand:- start:2244 stop:2549 length:306 start_codon:yes stop_codon:yes gene_type:complete
MNDKEKLESLLSKLEDHWLGLVHRASDLEEFIGTEQIAEVLYMALYNIHTDLHEIVKSIGCNLKTYEEKMSDVRKRINENNSMTLEELLKKSGITLKRGKK